MTEYLEFSSVGKLFPGVVALDDISFRVNGGRILALLGENGAGKSTLLKILSGDITPDMGKVLINGEEQRFASPYHAIKSGVSVIYQERQLIPTLTVMENIFLGDAPLTKAGIISRAELKRQTREILDVFELPISPTELVGRLSVAYQQMVEIMKAYRRDSRIIAFDEPTAPLTDTEIKILFNLIRKLRDDGKIIIYVSHRIKEIFEITDEIVILKDGKFVTALNTAETDEASLIAAMVGRDIGDTYAGLSRNENFGEVLLEVEHLETEAVHDVSFSLRAGEIIGFAGLVGAGRTEVARAIFGVDRIRSGRITLDGEPARFKTPQDAIERGVALCPEDRKEQGLVLMRSIAENITIPVLAKVRKWIGIAIDKKIEAVLANDAVVKYSVKTPSIDKIVMELSGGNQQKVILGRWTSAKMSTKVLILDEPTKGIDVGTKAEIYQTVCDFAKQGIGVIFISSELTEVINVSDRIMVMHNGRITGALSREDASEEKILALAMSD
ncbi:MAG: sugar ABC transporter ATP-binding protein [Oscillospiraceae bacterium]|jgi:ABC-type sugar transport system ATPase subunit|nr:sugar ABC transporter ATP-binding protein [Oscillospiraceae bacterium]